MTIYEEFIKEGEKRGIERGKEIGEKIANRAKENQFITQGFKKGLDNQLLAELTGLSTEEVESRIKELGLEK